MSLRELTRRQFVQWVARLSAGIAALFTLWGLTRFLSPNVAEMDRTARRIGHPADFPIGSKKFLPDLLAYIVRDETGFWAISARCTHLGCATSAVDWGFLCPCHGSKFDRYGNVLVGPAARRLPGYKLSLAPDGFLVLDVRVQVPPGTALQVVDRAS